MSNNYLTRDLALKNNLVELKDGKILFKQKAVKWEDATSTLKGEYLDLYPPTRRRKY